MTTKAPVIVIGAGIVGTATARALQRAGHAVTLLDSAEPGKATSYGNAGFIAIDHVLPLARPSTLKRVPQMLMDRNGPLTVHPPSLPYLLPWMARFARAAYSTAEVQQGRRFLRAADGRGQHRLEGRDPGLGPGRALQEPRRALRLRERGVVRRGAEERELQKAKGTEFEIVDGNRARELAPGLVEPHRARRLLSARHAHHQSLPGGDDAGRALRRRRRHDRCAAACAASAATAARSPAVQLTDSELPAKAVVIAAGRASGELTRLLGFNAPLVAERGYHVMLAPDNVRFDLPVSPAERGFFITPMEEGLRVAGTVELAAPHQPPSWHRADLLVRHLKDIFPGVGGAEHSRWIGERPSLPDFRPGDRPRAAARQRLLRLRPPACRPDARHRDRPADRPPDGGRGAAGSALPACDPGRFG